MTALQIIYDLAQKQGFSLVKVASPEVLARDRDVYLQWIADEKQGEMSYLARNPPRRYDPQETLPNAKSIIFLALNYFQELPNGNVKIARYTLTKADYHKVFEKKLKSLQSDLEKAFPENIAKFYVDYGPLMERPYAAQSSMGFIGKNTLLITKPFGSWVLLGEIITTLDIAPETPEKHGSCGSCRKCLDICPTGALKGPYDLDSRLCISYLTIEYHGSIPLALRKKIGTWLFGCDLCQEVCPHNTRAKAYSPNQWHDVVIAEDLKDPNYLISLAFLKRIMSIKDESEFRQFFANTPFLRTKREGLIRNACIVAGNLGNPELLHSLQLLLHDSSSLIQEHATWAIEEIRTLTP